MRHERHLVAVISVNGRRQDNSGRMVGISGRLLVNGTLIRIKMGPVKRRGHRGMPLPAQRAPRGERQRQVLWRRCV